MNVKRKEVFSSLKENIGHFLLKLEHSMIHRMRTHINRDMELKLTKEPGCDERPDIKMTSRRKTFWMIGDKCNAIVDCLMQVCARLCFFDQM